MPWRQIADRLFQGYLGGTPALFLRAAPGEIIEGEASFSGLDESMGCLQREAPSGEGMESDSELGLRDGGEFSPSENPTSFPKQVQLRAPLPWHQRQDAAPRTGGGPVGQEPRSRGSVCCGCICIHTRAPLSPVDAEGLALEGILFLQIPLMSVSRAACPVWQLHVAVERLQCGCSKLRWAAMERTHWALRTLVQKGMGNSSRLLSVN